MQVEVNGTRLWFDADGPALVPDGAEMREGIGLHPWSFVAVRSLVVAGARRALPWPSHGQ
jgi:hypothetical protein